MFLVGYKECVAEGLPIDGQGGVAEGLSVACQGGVAEGLPVNGQGGVPCEWTHPVGMQRTQQLHDKLKHTPLQPCRQARWRGTVSTFHRRQRSGVGRRRP